MSTEIHIYGSTSKLVGDFPKAELREVTSYPVQGAEFSKAYRKGLWDGRKHLFNLRHNSFPTGLLETVRKACEDLGYPTSIVDHRPPPSSPRAGAGVYDLVGVSMTGKYDYQLEAAKTMVAARQGVVKIATNGGKTEIACAVTKYLGLYTLFVVTNRELLYQAQQRFMDRLDLTSDEVGLIGDGHWKPGSVVTIATVDTLESRINESYCQQFLESIEVLFIDECHHVGSETWYTVSVMCPATYRFGLSGTPLDRTDGANLRLIAATGEIIVNISNKFLVERGISAKADIIFDSVTEPIIPKNSRYPTAYKKGVSENKQLLNKVVEWTKIFHKAGLGTLILVEEINQGKVIDDLLWTEADGEFIPHTFIHGTEDTEVRRNALVDFSTRRLPVLIASTILDEGVDVPTIDALILAGSRKSRIRTMQRLGRGLRGKKLIVVEFANYTHKHLVTHSLERLKDYREEECFDIYNSSPNLELVQNLWSKDDNKEE